MVQGWVKDLSTESGSRQEERGLHGHLKKASALTQRTERMGEEDSVDGQHIADVSRAGLRADGPKTAAPSQGDTTNCDSGTGAATVLRLQDFVTCHRVFFPLTPGPTPPSVGIYRMTPREGAWGHTLLCGEDVARRDREKRRKGTCRQHSCRPSDHRAPGRLLRGEGSSH